MLAKIPCPAYVVKSVQVAKKQGKKIMLVTFLVI
jgi:hypothetical protein